MSHLRNVRLLAWFNFFSDFRLFGPVTIIYFANVSGSYVLATSVLSITMLASALFEVPTGVVSDRTTRKGTMVVGAIGSITAVTLYFVASTYWVLVAGAIAEGFSRALFSGNNQALLYDSLLQEGREGEYAEHSGRVSSMFQLALAISAAFGGIVASSSLRATVGISILPQLLCVLVALRVSEPLVHGPIEANAFSHLVTAIRNIRQNPKLRRVVVASSLGHGAGETAFQLQPAFIGSLWPTWAIGIARTGNNGLAFLSFRLSGRVIARLGATKTLLVGQTWSNAANFAAVVKPTVFSPALITSESLTYGTSTVANGTLQQQEFTDSERATMASMVSLLGSAVFAVVAVAAGFVADRWGLRIALIACQAASAPSLYIYWRVHRHAERGSEGEQ